MSNSNGKYTRERGQFLPLDLGRVVITKNAMSQLDPISVTICLTLHRGGDWGELAEEDREANEHALLYGERILSVYHSMDGVTFWIITERDRSYTTILLPEDY